MHGGRGGGRGSNNLFFKPAPTMQNGGSRGGSRGKPSAAAGAGAQRPSMGAAGSNVPTASAGHHIDTANGLQKVEAAGQPTHGAVPHMQMHRMPYGHAPPHAKVRRPHPSPSPHLSGSVTIKPCSCTAGGPSYSLNLGNPGTHPYWLTRCFSPWTRAVSAIVPGVQHRITIVTTTWVDRMGAGMAVLRREGRRDPPTRDTGSHTGCTLTDPSARLIQAYPQPPLRWMRTFL